MTGFKFLAAATILSALIASSAQAQPVVQEPGLVAFYHPESNLGMGSSGPSADAQAMSPRLVMRHPFSVRHVRSAK